MIELLPLCFMNSRGMSDMFRRFFLCGTVVWAGFSTGCGEQVPVPATSKARSEPTEQAGLNDGTSSGSMKPVDGEIPSATTSIEMTEINWNELQTMIAEHKGKIVVVDVWSTACEPCMREFPNLITLQKSHPDEVVAISFDIDYAGIKNKPVSYYRERVLKFLGAQAESRVLHRMCNTAADDLFAEINLDSIPAIYVYGRDGALARRFDGSNASYEKQVVPFVNDLIR